MGAGACGSPLLSYCQLQNTKLIEVSNDFETDGHGIAHTCAASPRTARRPSRSRTQTATSPYHRRAMAHRARLPRGPFCQRVALWNGRVRIRDAGGEPQVGADASLAPQSAVAEIAAEASPAQPPEIAPRASEQPVLWPRDEANESSAPIDRLAAVGPDARPQAGISLQAQALATFGQPLPREAVTQALVRDIDVVAPAEPMPREELRPAVVALDDVRALGTLVLSGLPQGSLVQHGVDVGDGTIVIPGDQGRDIDVKLPDRVRETVRAEVEMIGPDGVKASGFALTIRPSTGLRAGCSVRFAPKTTRTPRSQSGRSGRRRQNLPSRRACRDAGAVTRAALERRTFICRRGDPNIEGWSRRERAARAPYEDGEPRSKGWSLFGLFGGN